jgi:hypothetical protein
MSSREDSQLKRVLHAYHEAGHAVVWHVVGGLVEDVSIASSQAGYKGYCRFGFLLPQVDDHPSPDEWLQRGRIDPRTVTAYYAGMLAMAYFVPRMAERAIIKRAASGTIWRKSIACFCVSVLRNRSVRPYKMPAGLFFAREKWLFPILSVFACLQPLSMSHGLLRRVTVCRTTLQGECKEDPIASERHGNLGSS